MPQTTVINRYMAKLGMSPIQVNFEDSLTFDEVAKFFSVPIAEAANHLGVCSSVLKKICRDNGIPRWPYRKFLAGKTIEEIKREAVREKEVGEDAANVSNDSEKAAPQSLSPNGGSSTSEALSKPTNEVMHSKGDDNANDTIRGQLNVPVGNLLQTSGTKMPQAAKQNTHNKSYIPTYLDDFKQGFPRNGLTTVTDRWWGSREQQTEQKISEFPVALMASEKYCQAHVSKPRSIDKADFTMPTDSESVINTEDSGSQGVQKHGHQTEAQSSDMSQISMLTRLRRKSAEDGRRALRMAATHGYRTFKLQKKQSLLLQKIFGSSLPTQWKESVDEALGNQ